MQKVFLIVLVFLASTGDGNAQSVSGFIHDQQGNSLSNISVSIRELFSGTVSDSGGHFTVTLPAAGNYTLVAEATGYGTVIKSLAITNDKNTELELTLNRSTTSLKEVIVTASRNPEIVDRTPASVQVINPKEFQTQSAISPNLS